jgi:hypothetical protein
LYQILNIARHINAFQNDKQLVHVVISTKKQISKNLERYTHSICI